MWKGDITIILVALFFVALALFIQIGLCLKVKSKIIRLLPVIILAVSAVIFTVLSAVMHGWDALGYFFLAVSAIFMLFACGIGWGIATIYKHGQKEK